MSLIQRCLDREVPLYIWMLWIRDSCIGGVYCYIYTKQSQLMDVHEEMASYQLYTQIQSHQIPRNQPDQREREIEGGREAEREAEREGDRLVRCTHNMYILNKKT